MIRNQVEYWRHLEASAPGERPTPRVCRLLVEVFERWRRKPAWLTDADTGSIFTEKSDEECAQLKQLSVGERKGLALQRLVGLLTDPALSARTETVRIHPDELIFGTIPPYAVGTGKELVRYLTDEEELRSAVNFLDDRSPFGHVVPNHAVELERGLGAVLTDLERREEEDAERAPFYRSVHHAVTAVLMLAEGWAERLEDEAKRHAGDARAALLEGAARFQHVPRDVPRSFLEAVQSVFLVHMALHSTGETVPLGRMDQLLWPFLETELEEGTLDLEGAQEIVDCFIVKLDERVTLNHDVIEDHFTFADGALLGTKGGSNFDQGGLVNQWMQQLTLGGVVADDDPECNTDATNPLTYLFLESARRLPVNSPTFDLRVHAQSSDRLLRAAARALLSGGAHPILLNDDRIIPALHRETGGRVDLRSAKNYACDGCYETLFAGETEFSFGVISAPDAIDKALNQGANVEAAGPIHLRGAKGSFRTPPASELKGFEHFWDEMERHLELNALRFVSGILTFYGEKEAVSPSPLLSAFIEGCVETGRDFAGGGAKYHLISPLMTAISTAADSLWVLDHLVFGGSIEPAELVTCLRQNWEPTAWSIGPHVSAERMAEIHAAVRAAPKYGHGNADVDRYAWRLVQSFTKAVQDARHHPMFDDQWARLRKTYDHPERPFEILFAPGVGTFEQYVFGGGFIGATPDGRKAGTPIASDFSASPIPADEPALDELGEHRCQVPLLAALQSFADGSIDALSDGAPADITIPEDFPEAQLVEVLRRFADGRGGNLLTFTTADPETLDNARANPDDYDLVRVRMGGWTEFFITLFPAHQEQHRRRPLYIPEEAQ